MFNGAGVILTSSWRLLQFFKLPRAVTALVKFTDVSYFSFNEKVWYHSFETIDRTLISECAVSVPSSHNYEIEIDRLDNLNLGERYAAMKIDVEVTLDDNIWDHVCNSKSLTELLDGFENIQDHEVANLLIILIWNKYLEPLAHSTFPNHTTPIILKSLPYLEDLINFWDENIENITTEALCALCLLMKLQKLDESHLWNKAVTRCYKLRHELLCSDLVKVVFSLKDKRNEILNRSLFLDVACKKLLSIKDTSDLVFISACFQCYRQLLSDSTLKLYYSIICNWTESKKMDELEPSDIVKILAVLDIKGNFSIPNYYSIFKKLLFSLHDKMHLISIQEMKFLKEINQDLGFLTAIDNSIVTTVKNLLRAKSEEFWDYKKVDYLTVVGLLGDCYWNEPILTGILFQGINNKMLLPMNLHLFLKLKSFKHSSIHVFHQYLRVFCRVLHQDKYPDSVIFPVIISYVEASLQLHERCFDFENSIKKFLENRLVNYFGHNVGNDIVSLSFLLLFDRDLLKEPVMKKFIEVLPKLSNYGLMLTANALHQRKKRFKYITDDRHENLLLLERELVKNLPHYMKKCSTLLHYSSLLRTIPILSNNFVADEYFNLCLKEVLQRKDHLYPKIIYYIGRALCTAKYKSPEIVSAFEEFFLEDNCSSISSLRTYLEMCYITQCWPNSEKFYAAANQSILSHMESNVVHVLPAMFFLATLGLLSEKIIANIFSINFMKVLTEYENKGFSRSKYFMNLNRLLCLMHPEKRLPWLCSDDMDIIPVTRRDHILSVAGVLQTIPRFSNVFKTFSSLAYNISAYIEMRADRLGNPCQLKQWDNNVLGMKKISLLPLSNNSFCSNDNSQLCGFQSTHKLSLELLGYSVVIIPESEWNSLDLSSLQDKQGYLAKKLENAGFV